MPQFALPSFSLPLLEPVLTTFHDLAAGQGLDPGGVASWTAAIIALTVLVRLLLLPLAVHQVRTAARVRSVAPQVAAVRDRYAGRTDAESRRALQSETMDAYRAAGTSPVAGCLPALLQAPVFLSLFWSVQQIGEPLAGTLGGAWSAGDPGTTAVFLTLVLVVAGAQCLTARAALLPESPALQRTLTLVLPVVFALTGAHFPLGVLVYWCTTNLWTLGQQLVVRRRARR